MRNILDAYFRNINANNVYCEQKVRPNVIKCNSDIQLNPFITDRSVRPKAFVKSEFSL
jgi:hypothetical protein